METKHVESLEEIIFKDRNKQYGAYSLRKNYSNHILISLCVAILFMGSALTYPLMMNREQKRPPKVDSLVVISDPFSIKTLPPPEVPDPPAAPAQPKADKVRVFTVPEVSDETNEADYGKQELLAENKPSPIGVSQEPGETLPEKPEPAIPVPEKSEPVLWVPEMPHFPGGENEMHTFLASRIRYPGEAREVSIQGTVFITFVVETDGSITNIRVLRGIGSGCEEEAIRVIKSMPPWVPGKQNGIAVRVRLTLPVKFTLQ